MPGERTLAAISPTLPLAAGRAKFASSRSVDLRFAGPGSSAAGIGVDRPQRPALALAEVGAPCSRLGVDVSMPDAPRWPTHLQALGDRVQPGPDARPDEELCGRIWLLIHGALSRYLRLHAASLGGCSIEEQEDIAAQKSIMLLRRMTSGEWRPGERAPGEIAAFLSRIAHNALVDHLRGENRFVREDGWPDEAAADGDRPRAAAALDGREGRRESPDLAVERNEYVAALRDCAQRLQPRARTVWFFRVFYDMPSKAIAQHPEVGLNPAHVDVLLQRCRAAVGECMRTKGHRPQDMPPGTFAGLWAAFRCERATEPSSGGAP